MSYVTEDSTYAICITFPILCSLSVALRFVARKKADMRLEIDDWVAVVALLLTVSYGILLAIGLAIEVSQWNQERHGRPYSKDQLDPFIQTQFIFAVNPISVVAIGFIRLTFGLLYRRLFRHSPIYPLIRIAIVVTILWTLTFFVASFFGCGQFFGTRHYSIEFIDGNVTLLCERGGGATVATEKYIPVALTASDVAIDIMIFLLPVLTICSLNMSNHQKFLILLVFLAGVLPIVASIWRLVIAVSAINKATKESTFKPHGNNYTINGFNYLAWNAWQDFWWTYVEMGVGCLVSNLPPIIGLVRGNMRNPWRAMIKRITFSKRRRQSSSTYSVHLHEESESSSCRSSKSKDEVV